MSRYLADIVNYEIASLSSGCRGGKGRDMIIMATPLPVNQQEIYLIRPKFSFRIVFQAPVKRW